MESISNTAERATGHVKEAASHARTTLLDLSMQVMKLINNAREAEGRGVDTVLDRLGLQRRRSPLGPVLWFAAGAVAAGTVVLLTTPESGKKLRERIVSLIGGETERVATAAQAVQDKVEQAVKPLSDHLPPNGAKHPTG